MKWVLCALIEAEEHGVTRDNVRTLVTTTVHPAIQRLLGVHGRFGKALGVSNDWVVRVVGSVGNYGEIVDPLPVGGSGPLCAGTVLRHWSLAAGVSFECSPQGHW